MVLTHGNLNVDPLVVWNKCLFRSELVENFIVLKENGDLIWLRLVYHKSIIEWKQETLIIWVSRISLWAAVWPDENPHAERVLPAYIFRDPSHVYTLRLYFLRLGEFMEELSFIERGTDVIRTIITSIETFCFILTCNNIYFVHSIVVFEKSTLSETIVSKNLTIPGDKLIFHRYGLFFGDWLWQDQKFTDATNEVELIIASSQTNWEGSLSLLKRKVFLWVLCNHTFHICL